MACEKCKQAGQTKVIHFARCGRWDTRVYCKHSYTRGKLIDNEGTAQTYAHGDERKEVRHVLSRHDVAPLKTSTRSPPETKRTKHPYSEAEDKFILTHYTAMPESRNHRGEGVMKKMLTEFAEVFGWLPTTNQVVGRYNRLCGLKQDRKPMEKTEKLEEVRGVPSLPVLKFMGERTDV
jgi:hypothetical protein